MARCVALSLACCAMASGIRSVLVTDGLAPAAISLLGSSGVRVVEQHYAKEDLGRALRDHDAVIIRSATTLDANIIATAAAGSLRVIGRAGVGVDNVDLDAARSAGCWVLNTPGASTASVVELTLAHMLAAARGLQDADQGLKSGRWLKGQIKLGASGGPRFGHELSGKRLGILGFGRIAQAQALSCKALGMSVHATSRNADAAAAAAIGVTLEASDIDLFSRCTHVVVLCALNEETRGLVDLRRMELMPECGADGTPCGSHLFNMARGGIVKEEDVAVALRDGVLSTYATDVFEQEPPPAESPLLRCGNFYGTPHVGAATLEAQARVGESIVTSVLGALQCVHADEGAVRPEGIVCEPGAC